MSAKERIKAAAQKANDAQPRHALGHGFLWVELRNGQRFVAVCIDGRANHDKILAAVREEVGVRHAWINLD